MVTVVYVGRECGHEWVEEVACCVRSMERWIGGGGEKRSGLVRWARTRRGSCMTVWGMAATRSTVDMDDD